MTGIYPPPSYSCLHGLSRTADSARIGPMQDGKQGNSCCCLAVNDPYESGRYPRILI